MTDTKFLERCGKLTIQTAPLTDIRCPCGRNVEQPVKWAACLWRDHLRGLVCGKDKDKGGHSIHHYDTAVHWMSECNKLKVFPNENAALIAAVEAVLNPNKETPDDEEASGN